VICIHFAKYILFIGPNTWMFLYILQGDIHFVVAFRLIRDVVANH